MHINHHFITSNLIKYYLSKTSRQTEFLNSYLELLDSIPLSTMGLGEKGTKKLFVDMFEELESEPTKYSFLMESAVKRIPSHFHKDLLVVKLWFILTKNFQIDIYELAEPNEMIYPIFLEREFLKQVGTKYTKDSEITILSTSPYVNASDVNFNRMLSYYYTCSITGFEVEPTLDFSVIFNKWIKQNFKTDIHRLINKRGLPFYYSTVESIKNLLGSNFEESLRINYSNNLIPRLDPMIHTLIYSESARLSILGYPKDDTGGKITTDPLI